MKTFRITLLASLLVASAAILDAARPAPSAALSLDGARAASAAATTSGPAFLTEFGEVWTRNEAGEQSFVQDAYMPPIPRNALASTTLECGTGLGFMTGNRVVSGQGYGATELAALLSAKAHVLSALAGLSGVKCEWCPVFDACKLVVTTLDAGWEIVSQGVSDDGKTFYAMVTYKGTYTSDCTACE